MSDPDDLLSMLQALQDINEIENDQKDSAERYMEKSYRYVEERKLGEAFEAAMQAYTIYINMFKGNEKVKWQNEANRALKIATAIRDKQQSPMPNTNRVSTGSNNGQPSERQGVNPSSIMPAEPNALGFRDLAGMRTEKAKIIASVIRPLRFPKMLVSSRSLLMYGPPGTGKTMLARHMQGEFNLQFGQQIDMVFATGASIKGKYYGESEKNLRAYFTRCQSIAVERDVPFTILFVDEFDALAEDRNKSEGPSIVNEMLTLIGSDEYNRVLFVAATNLPQNLDSAVMRRMQLTMLVDLPNDVARREMVMQKIRKRFFVDDAKIYECDFCEQFINLIVEWTGLSEEGADTLSKKYKVGKTDVSLGKVRQSEAKSTYGYSFSDMNNALDGVFNDMAVAKLRDDTGRGCSYICPADRSRCKICDDIEEKANTLKLELKDINTYGKTADKSPDFDIVKTTFMKYRSTITDSDYLMHMNYQYGA